MLWAPIKIPTMLLGMAGSGNEHNGHNVGELSHLNQNQNQQEDNHDLDYHHAKTKMQGLIDQDGVNITKRWKKIFGKKHFTGRLKLGIKTHKQLKNSALLNSFLKHSSIHSTQSKKSLIMINFLPQATKSRIMRDRSIIAN